MKHDWGVIYLESTMEMWPFWIVGDLSHEKIGISRENDHILQMLAK